MTPSPRFPRRRQFKDIIPKGGSIAAACFSLRILLGIMVLVVISTTLVFNYRLLMTYQTDPNHNPSSTSASTSASTSSSSKSTASSSTIIQQNQHQPQRRLEFVHITKTAGSAIEKAAAAKGILWGACHYMKLDELNCSTPDIAYKAPNYQSYAFTSPWHTPPKILQRRILQQQQQQVQETANTHTSVIPTPQSIYPYQDADLFTVVRNPYDRFVSEYYCPWAGYKGDQKKKDDPNTMNAWIQHTLGTMDKLLSDFNVKQQKKHPMSVSYIQQGPNLNEDPYLLAQKHFINQVEYVYDGNTQIIQHVLHYENLTLEFASLMSIYHLNIHLAATNTPLSSDSFHHKNTTNNISSIVYKKDGKLSSLDLYPDTIAVINKYAKQDFLFFGYTMR